MAEVLILGCGYTGIRLGRRLAAGGHRVTGTTRSEDRAARLREAGLDPLLLDVSRPADRRRLEEAAPDVCFYLIPPVRTDGAGAGGGGHGPLEDVIRRLRRAPMETFVYGSSTSVYGDRDGAWVDEGTVPRPDGPTGEARLEAERTVLRCGWAYDARPRIGRIAGIYGPGRTLREALQEGRYQVVEGSRAWSNRIHVDDLVTGLVAVWQRGVNGRVYNLADGHPHRSEEFAGLVAELLGLELPRITLEEARERYSEARLARKLGSKRVRNRRLRQELEVELAYPSYRQGVPAALREEGALPDGG